MFTPCLDITNRYVCPGRLVEPNARITFRLFKKDKWFMIGECEADTQKQHHIKELKRDFF